MPTAEPYVQCLQVSLSGFHHRKVSLSVLAGSLFLNYRRIFATICVAYALQLGSYRGADVSKEGLMPVAFSRAKLLCSAGLAFFQLSVKCTHVLPSKFQEPGCIVFMATVTWLQHLVAACHCVLLWLNASKGGM